MQTDTKTIEFEVATFDSDTSGAIVMEGGLSYNDALKLANDTWDSGKWYGVEIVSCDPNDLDPIHWIRTKSKFIESY